MRLLLFLFMGFVSTKLFSQDTVWNEIKVDENMKISMPGRQSLVDTSVTREGHQIRYKMSTGQINGNNVLLVITPEGTNINADNKESFKEAMKGIKTGLTKSFISKGLKYNYQDTLVDNIDCLKATLYTESADDPKGFYYVFLLNDKMYSITYAMSATHPYDSAKKDIDRLLNSIRFNKSFIKERQFDTKAESTGYKIGYLLGKLFAIAVFAGAFFLLVYFIVRKKKNNPV